MRVEKETAPITVLLAEDHALVREGTRRILEQYPDIRVVGEAGDGQEAIEMLLRLQPDVALLDIRMPKLTGIDVVRRMREVSLRTRAVMLTGFDDDEYILALMEAGASGYLLKTIRPGRLAEAVRAVYQGETVLDPAIAAKVARLWSSRASGARQEPSDTLSPRERDVLELAAKGLRNRDIADKLSISVRTVEGHFNNILAKLGVDSRVEAILHAVSRGWVALEEDA